MYHLAPGHSSVSPELVAATNVLLELTSICKGAFSLSDFDDIVIKKLIELICTN